MKINLLKNLTRAAFVVALLLTGEAWAQTPAKWSGVHGNEWIDYSKSFVRIGIKTKGLHKIPFSILTTDFKNKANGNYQLFHRGVEVKIIVNANEIIFYGEPNDGESDKWLFRPGPEARINPYVSFFSDEGSYILTYAEGAKRMTPAVDGTSYSGDPEPYHFQKFIKTYNNQFSYSSVNVVVPENLNNSFYEKRNTYVGPTITGVNKGDEPISFVNWASSALELPTLEVMMLGFSNTSHSFDFSVGKTSADADHQTVLQSLTFVGINADKSSVFNIPSANLNSTGGVLRTKSNQVGGFAAQAYYILTYPQLSTMNGLNSLFMNFKSSSSPVHVGITNAEADVVLYNITDPHNPQVVQGQLVGSTYHASVPRSPSEELRLLAARPSAIAEVTSGMIVDGLMQPSYSYPQASLDQGIDPEGYDYLIITSRPFLGEADNYAKYRNSTEGGSYRSAVFDIKSIYNQFNYGEPSPVAIKRFVDFMVSKGIRARHNLLLIGNSVTAHGAPTGGVVGTPGQSRLVKELPFEIPSIGDPGSDFLLVAGVHGLGQDIPAIPVGRLPVLTAPLGGGAPITGETTYYLNKVKKYESATGDLSWRRNLIHIDGGKEGETFTSQYLNPIIPIAKTLDPSKPVQTVGTSQTSNVIKPADITEQINNGTGMITYYGHGAYNYTQFNIGYVTRDFNATSNNFTSTGGAYLASPTNTKFPFIYFNGCGVGNAYQSTNPLSRTLAADWILAENRGAIGIIGSSFNSFATPTATYLEILYSEIFTKTDQERKTIGQIKNEVARQIIAGNFNRRVMAIADDYDRNNLHIANLFGDPAVRILATTVQPPVPLPVEFSFIRAVANGVDNVTVNWKTAWEKNNSRFVVQRSTNAVDFIDVGVVDGKGTVIESNSYSFVDVSPAKGGNYYRVGQIDLGDTEPKGFSRTVSVNLKSAEWLTVSPNPASNFVDLNLDALYNLKAWKLFNIQGRKIKEGKVKKISLEGLLPGDYILEIEMSNNEVHTRKLAKY